MVPIIRIVGHSGSGNLPTAVGLPIRVDRVRLVMDKCVRVDTRDFRVFHLFRETTEETHRELVVSTVIAATIEEIAGAQGRHFVDEFGHAAHDDQAGLVAVGQRGMVMADPGFFIQPEYGKMALDLAVVHVDEMP